jgi:Transposase DDE domain
MLLNPLFERFAHGSPLSVMARGAIEHALATDELDALFERTAQVQYTRELLFSSIVDLMSLVVCGSAPHVQAAFHRLRDQIPVSLTSVYDKLQRVEPAMSAALVRFVAQRCGSVITQSGGANAPWVPGWRVKVVDGNHLAATEHRLAETRRLSSGPLPGLALVVFDPALGLPIEVFPCEDAHAQERSLLPALVATAMPWDIWIADRNFCTADYLVGLADRNAGFVIRHHANLRVTATSDWGPEASTATGGVSERSVNVTLADQVVLTCRQVRVRLTHATRDQDREIVVLSNVPVEVATAAKVAELYRKRWTIEGVFSDLARNLNCEVKTLCYPKAALFGFCVGLVAYAVSAVVRAALRAVHGAEKIESELSGYYVAWELGATYLGMMIAIPSGEWGCFGEMTTAELVRVLRELAGRVDLRRYRKQVRKPKKAPVKRIHRKDVPHVSTARILDKRKSSRAKE